MSSAFFWSHADIAEAVYESLKRRVQQDDLEQAVYGIDALDELALHPIIAHGLADAGYHVRREQRYPGHWHKTKKSHGLRCDIVLTPQGKPLRDPDIKNTIFDSDDAVDPEAAYWLEIKTVSQFTSEGPFRRYSSELLAPVPRDVTKLWTDGIIAHAGLLLVLFTANQELAEHDLMVWHQRCLDRGIPAMPPAVRSLAITDRMGNAWCTAAVFGVRG